MNILDLAKQSLLVYEDKESDEVNDNEAPAYEDLSPIEQKIVDFMLLYPNPPDEEIHKFAQSLKLDPDQFETEIYKLLSKLINDEYAEKAEDFDEEEEEEDEKS